MDSVSIRYLPRIRFRFRWIYLLYLALAVVYNISGFHLFALTNRQITGVGVSLAHFGFLNNSHLSRVWRIYYYDTWEMGGWCEGVLLAIVPSWPHTSPEVTPKINLAADLGKWSLTLCTRVFVFLVSKYRAAKSNVVGSLWINFVCWFGRFGCVTKLRTN